MATTTEPEPSHHNEESSELQRKIPHATAKTQCSQINTWFLKRERDRWASIGGASGFSATFRGLPTSLAPHPI